MNGENSLTELPSFLRRKTTIQDFTTRPGFPLDLTELMARERGLTVDVAGFEKVDGRTA